MRRCEPLVLPALLLLPVLADSADAQRRRGPRNQSEFQNLTFENKRFESKAMKKQWSYGILLPKDYAEDKSKTYPWIVHLHGMREDHQRFSYRGGAEVLDEMLGKKQIPEVIVVCAEGTRTSFFMNGKYSPRYEDMVVTDLVQHIEETYRVKKGREHRALLGWSAGGGGALRIALSHPDVFGVVATHSAAILPKDSKKLKRSSLGSPASPAPPWWS